MKSTILKIRQAVIVLAILGLGLLIITTTQAVIYRQEDFEPGISQQSQEPQYAPGELIIKLKEDASKALDAKLASSPELQAYSIGISYLDEIPASYKVTIDGISPVFMTIKQKELKDNISFQQQVEQIKAKFPQRTKRIDPNAKIPDLSKIYKITFKEKDTNILNLCQKYQQDPSVEYAEPNYIATVFYIPNDPLYPRQWAHLKTQAGHGWAIERGNPDVIIAIVDTGVDYNHEDMTANIWRDNEGNPGKDFVDIYTAAYTNAGYQLVQGEDYTQIDNDPSDYNGHGTHSAGIAGAVGNNGIGVAGVCHNCKIMPVRAGFSIIHPQYGEIGLFEFDDIVNAITYATDNDAQIINMSFGGSNTSQMLKGAIDYATYQGVLLIAAAGNSNSYQPKYPAGYESVISVAATTIDDLRAPYSNYGSWVDVAAPGGYGGSLSPNTQILSTVPLTGTLGDPSGYRTLQGTSMASPYVSGIGGLILSKNPDFNNIQLRQIIKQSVDNPDSNKYIGTGRVNVYKALQVDSMPDVIAEITSPIVGELINDNSIDIIGTATGNEYVVEYGEGIYPSQWNEIGYGSQVINGVLASWDTTGINPGHFVLRLVVSYYNAEIEERVWVLVPKYNKDFLEGWPKRMSTLTKGFSSPAIGDLDGDGDLEVVIAGSNGVNEEIEPTVYAWHHNGTTVAGWPKFTDSVKFGSFLNQDVCGSPVLIDLDNNGTLEIIVGADDGKVYIWNYDGKDFIANIWPKQTEGKFRSSPVVGDLDDDGAYEIVIADPYGRLYAWHQDGTALVPGTNGLFFSFANPLNEQPLENTPAIADLDNDGYSEIIMTFSVSPSNSKLYIFNYMGQKIIDFFIGKPYSTSPIIGDIDGDGSLEIIVACSGKMYAFKNTGELKEGNWPVETPDSKLYNPFMGDINNDGKLEIVSSSSDNLYVFDYQGNYLFDPIQLPFGRKTALSASALGDIDGDGDIEIILATAGVDSELSIFAWHHDGIPVEGWPFLEPIRESEASYASGVMSSPALCDLDRDSYLDLVVAGHNGKVYAIKTGSIYNPSTMEWPRFRHNAHNTGLYAPPPSIDVGITSLSFSDSTPKRLDTIDINVDIENTSQNPTGGFSLDWYVNGTFIGSSPVQEGLSPGENRDITYSWTITGDIGCRQIKASIQRLPGENNTSNNTLQTSLLVDLTGDGQIRTDDIMLVTSRWNSQRGDSNYEPVYDLDDDGSINIYDILKAVILWKVSCK